MATTYDAVDLLLICSFLTILCAACSPSLFAQPALFIVLIGSVCFLFLWTVSLFVHAAIVAYITVREAIEYAATIAEILFPRPSLVGILLNPLTLLLMVAIITNVYYYATRVLSRVAERAQLDQDDDVGMEDAPVFTNNEIDSSLESPTDEIDASLESPTDGPLPNSSNGAQEEAEAFVAIVLSEAEPVPEPVPEPTKPSPSSKAHSFAQQVSYARYLHTTEARGKAKSGKHFKVYEHDIDWNGRKYDKNHGKLEKQAALRRKTPLKPSLDLTKVKSKVVAPGYGGTRKTLESHVQKDAATDVEQEVQKEENDQESRTGEAPSAPGTTSSQPVDNANAVSSAVTRGASHEDEAPESEQSASTPTPISFSSRDDEQTVRAQHTLTKARAALERQKKIAATVMTPRLPNVQPLTKKTTFSIQESETFRRCKGDTYMYRKLEEHRSRSPFAFVESPLSQVMNAYPDDVPKSPRSKPEASSSRPEAKPETASQSSEEGDTAGTQHSTPAPSATTPESEPGANDIPDEKTADVARNDSAGYSPHTGPESLETPLAGVVDEDVLMPQAPPMSSQSAMSPLTAEDEGTVGAEPSTSVSLDSAPELQAGANEIPDEEMVDEAEGDATGSPPSTPAPLATAPETEPEADDTPDEEMINAAPSVSAGPGLCTGPEPMETPAQDAMDEDIPMPQAPPAAPSSIPAPSTTPNTGHPLVLMMQDDDVEMSQANPVASQSAPAAKPLGISLGDLNNILAHINATAPAAPVAVVPSPMDVIANFKNSFINSPRPEFVSTSPSPPPIALCSICTGLLWSGDAMRDGMVDWATSRCAECVQKERDAARAETRAASTGGSFVQLPDGDSEQWTINDPNLDPALFAIDAPATPTSTVPSAPPAEEQSDFLPNGKPKAKLRAPRNSRR